LYRPDDGLEEAYDSPDATDEDLPEGHPSRKSFSDSELAASESAAENGGDDSDGLAEDFVNNTTDDGEGGGRRKLSTRTRQAVSAGILSVVIGGSVGTLYFVQGPAQLIHLAKKLTGFHMTNEENHTDGRAGRLIKWARTQDNPERRNLGYLGNKMANHYEKVLVRSGMQPVYEGGRVGRFNAIDMDLNTEAGRRAAASMRSRGVELPAPGDDGKIRVDLAGTSAKQRRLAINGMVDGMSRGKISTAVSSRTLKLRGQVDFHPLKNISRSADEKISDYINRRMEQRNEGHQNGAPDGDLRVNGEDPVDENGERTTTNGSEAAEALEADKPASGSSADIDASASSLQGKIGAGVGATAVAGLICGLYVLGEEIPALQHQKVVVPLVRIGWEAVSIGSQLQSGDNVEWDEIGAFVKQMYDEELGSAFSAASIQAEENKEITGRDMPSEAKPGKEKPLLFRILDRVINSIPLGPTGCDALTSTVGGWALTIVGAALGATGPVGFLLTIASEMAQDLALGAAISGALRWYIGEPLEALPVGSLLGNYANFGVRLAANDSFISKGGTELSGSEDSALAADRKEMERHRIQNSSVFARYFDPSEPSSLVARTLFETETIKKPSTTVASMAAVFNPFNMLGGLGLRLSPAANAETSYDYGFPEYGFTLEEMESERLEDPYAIADRVEPNLAALNDEYGEDCFGVTVDPSTGAFSFGNELKRYDQIPDKCTSRSNQELTDYRMYLTDLSVAKSMACYEGLENSTCAELGFNPSPSSGQPTPGTGGSLPTGEAKDLAQQILDSGKVTGDSRYMAQIQGIADGTGDCYVNPTILGMIAALSTQFEMKISSLNRRCTGVLTASGEGSYHYRGQGGHAVDFNYINGVHSTGATADDIALIQAAAAIVPAGSGFGQSNCRGNSPLTLPGMRQFSDTCNHVHIEVPEQ
jgi:hypothetical protein